MITRNRTGPLYSAGLAVVAFAMVLLPLVYMTLIALTGWLVYLHLTRDVWIMSGRGAGLFKLIAYLGPAVAGVILLFFMVKPFFARRERPPQLIQLDPQSEPLLFAFVSRICALVGATVPCRIDVDCAVNASASLRRGFLSRDLVLTVGLPLVSGLNMRQFAGVLAHEFGHFAQGAGMRMTYIIRRINHWFARVVYERDQWDLQLEVAAKKSDWRIAIVMHMARGCVYVTRRMLWALMQAGTAISCFMLRQMEYDADSYEAKVAGSDAFEQTASRLRLLNVASHGAMEDLKQSWANRRLAEDLPLLIGHKVGCLPDDIRQKLADSAASEKTGWFDTHPCDADRVKAARDLNEPGVFVVEEPAKALFSNFAVLSRTVTRHQYEKHMELEISDENLMPTDEIVRESEASARAEALLLRFFGGANPALLPLFPTPDLEAGTSESDLKTQWEQSCQALEALQPTAVELSLECRALEQKMAELSTVYRLTKVGFHVDPAEFGLPTDVTTPGAQEDAGLQALEECSRGIQEKLTKVVPFFVALRRRVLLALSSAPNHPDLLNAATEVVHPEALVRLLFAVGAEIPRLRYLGGNMRGLLLLAQNRGNHADPSVVDEALSALAGELDKEISGIQARLSEYKYPFAHARGGLSVAAYAAYEKPEPNVHARTYMNACSHVERLFGLYYRLLGQLLAIVDVAETRLASQRNVGSAEALQA